MKEPFDGDITFIPEAEVTEGRITNSICPVCGNRLFQVAPFPIAFEDDMYFRCSHCNYKEVVGGTRLEKDF